MKHAKKLFAVLLAVLMVASMAGCAKNMICEDYRELNNDER